MTIYSIQYLRGLAAILVAYYHAVSFYRGMPSGIISKSDILTVVGGAGVDIFFVISGFVMMHIFHSKKLQFKDFLVRRFNRIVPLYWFYTTLFAFFMFYLAPSFQKDYFKLIGSYFFIPILGIDGNRQPILSVGWTLNYEIIFYLIFAFSFYLLRRFSPLLMIVSLLILSVLIYSGIYGKSFIEFFLGLACYKIYNKDFFSNYRISNNIIFFLGMLGIGIYLIIYGVDLNESRFTYWAAGSFLIVQSLVEIERRKIVQFKNRAFLMFGDASFSIYLTHWFWGFVTYKAFDYLNIPDDFSIIATFSIMVASGVFLYFTVERFFLQNIRIQIS